MVFGVLSMLEARIFTRNVTEQNPGSVGMLAGMSRAGPAVKMTWFIAEPPAGTLVVQVTGHGFELTIGSSMNASPSYSMIAPSSVHGGVKGKLELQSRLCWKLVMVSLVPPVMLQVPKLILTSTVSPMLLTGGAPR